MAWQSCRDASVDVEDTNRLATFPENFDLMELWACDGLKRINPPQCIFLPCGASGVEILIQYHFCFHYRRSPSFVSFSASQRCHKSGRAQTQAVEAYFSSRTKNKETRAIELYVSLLLKLSRCATLSAALSIPTQHKMILAKAHHCPLCNPLPNNVTLPPCTLVKYRHKQHVKVASIWLFFRLDCFQKRHSHYKNPKRSDT